MAGKDMSSSDTRKLTETDGRTSRRTSFGSTGSSNSRKKTVPHYLQPSAGSCHDSCKYGKKHAFEEKMRRPFPKRIAEKPVDKEIVVEFCSESKRFTPVKLMPSSNSKSHMSNSPEIIKREVPTVSVDKECPRSEDLPKIIPSGGMSVKEKAQNQIQFVEIVIKKNTSVPEKSAESADSQSSASTDILAGQKKKISTTKSRAVLGSKANASKKNITRDISSYSAKLEVPQAQATGKANEASLSVKPNLSAVAAPASIGNRNEGVKLREEAGTKRLAVKKTQGSPRVSMSPKASLGGVSKARSSLRISLPSKTSVVQVGKALASPSLSSSKALIRAAGLKPKNHKHMQDASPLNKSEKADSIQLPVKNADSNKDTDKLREIHFDAVQEKTLYPTAMETKNSHFDSGQIEAVSAGLSPPPSSSSNSTSTSQSPHAPSENEEDVKEEAEYTATESEDEVLSECDESEYIEVMDSLEGELKEVHGVGGMVPSGETNSQAVKLRFRRGKVVDIQSENNGPRRLKFRRARVLEGCQNPRVDVVKSFSRKIADGDYNSEQPESEKVILRHQEVQAKKDVQVLLNNVIEEMASKLVETRKSKVKALVGAFETVISLQDGKPPVNTVY